MLDWAGAALCRDIGDAMNGRENDRATWLRGPSAKCQTVPRSSAHHWRIVLLGPPGVGKGTQAALLTGELGACHLSPGDVFRAARGEKQVALSPAMAAALHCMT